MNAEGNIWKPGEFKPRPASKGEKLWLKFSPLGFEILPYIGPMIPGVLLEYAMSRGYALLGAIGLLLWLPVLWILLVWIHRQGRIRVWLSTSIAAVMLVVFGLVFASGSGH